MVGDLGLIMLFFRIKVLWKVLYFVVSLEEKECCKVVFYLKMGWEELKIVSICKFDFKDLILVMMYGNCYGSR